MTSLAILHHFAPTDTWEGLEGLSSRVHSATLKHIAPGLRQRIKDGSASVDEIEALLHDGVSVAAQMKPDLLEFLLLKKAWLLINLDRADEALQPIQRALSVNGDSPKAWIANACALLGTQHYDEALNAFERVYALKGKFGKAKTQYLTRLFQGWSGCALLLALGGILYDDLRESQKGVTEYLRVVDQAVNEKLPNAIMKPLTSDPSSLEISDLELREAIEELELMVRLLSIKDPFEGWRELTKEITKVWPKGVSAVDAIREQRE